VDKLFEQGERELDLARRIAIYQRLATVLYEDQPYTWLYYQSSFYGFNRELRGYMFSPRGPYSYSPGFFSIYKAITP
jgi:peptide/nickel transport system substrate-binding protein